MKIQFKKQFLPFVVILWTALIPVTSFADGLRLLVPAYANPCCDGGMWAQLIGTAAVMGPDLHVILNPASGPGASPIDPNFIGPSGEGPLIDLLDAGGFVIGYVATNYTMRSAAEVKSEIDLYYDPIYWRSTGTEIQGIFFDEMSNDLAHVGYYQDLRDHILNLDPSARVFGNPGTSFVNNPTGQSTWDISDYAESVDTMVTFEASANEYLTGYSAPSWIGTYPPERFGHIVHSEPDPNQMVDILTLAMLRKARYVYVTHDALPNPYDLIPSYWSPKVDAARGIIFADRFDSGETNCWTTSVLDF